MNQQLVDACKKGDYVSFNDLFSKLVQMQKECEDLMMKCGIPNHHIEDAKNQFLDINKLFGDACQGGNLQIVKFLIDYGAIKCRNKMDAACEYGHLHIIQYLFLTFCSQLSLPPDELKRIWRIICKNGHSNCVDFFLMKGVIISKSTFYDVLLSGNMEMIHFIYHHKDIQDIEDIHWDWALRQACKSLNIRAVQFVIDKGNNFDFNLNLSTAAETGKRDIVDLLIQNGAHQLHRGFSGALLNNQFEMALELIKKDPLKIMQKCSGIMHMSQVLKDDNLTRYCLMLDQHWNFQDCLVEGKRMIRALEIAFECGIQNIRLIVEPSVIYFLNRGVDLNQLTPDSLLMVARIQKKRKSIQNIMKTTLSFIRHTNITSIVQTVVLPQMSHK